MRIIDAHCHIQDVRLKRDYNSLISDAKAVGIEKLIVNGTSESDWEEVLEISKNHEEVIPLFGVHPWYVNEVSSSWYEKLISYLDATPSAVGEIGLDHGIKDRNDSLQEEIFIKQLRLAIDRGLPFSIHSRRSWDRLPKILEEHISSEYKPGFHIHAYSGPVDIIPKLSSLGCYFSFAGTLTWSRNKKAHKNIVAVPEDRLLLETDAPDMYPYIKGEDDNSEKINVPSNITYVLRKAAELRGVSEEELAQRTFENTNRLYTLNR